MEVWKVIGFVIYMMMEHELGKRESGSVIGVVKKFFADIIKK